MASVGDAGERTPVHPARQLALHLDSPMTPIAMLEYADQHMPNLRLAEGQFFTLEELKTVDLESLRDFVKPGRTEMIQVADKSNLFRQNTDE